MIKEIDPLPPETLRAAFQQVREWLSTSQSQEVVFRLAEAAGKVIANMREDTKPEEAKEILLTKPGDLEKQVVNSAVDLQWNYRDSNLKLWMYPQRHLKPALSSVF